MLNPAINMDQLRQFYSQHQAISIQNVLKPEIATDIHTALTQLDWDLEINDYNPTPRLKVPLHDIENPDAPLMNALDEIPNNQDRDKLFYMRLNVDGDRFQEPILKRFSEYLNSEDFLAPLRSVVGNPAISHSWMEATCYQPGCFLGGHRDDHHANNRVAFVFNLTPQWQMDWGGMLMLPNPNSQPTIIPVLWNSLSLFTVPRDHFVSAVSPAARGGRYSITGWLRD